jgi:G3E family GTPase
MNPRAPIKKVHFGEAPIAEMLDIRGFNLNAILEIAPEFLDRATPRARRRGGSFVFKSDKPFDGEAREFLGG